MDKKSWYESKTLWANLIGIAGVFLAGKGNVQVDEQTAVAALGTINVILRLITKKPISW